MHFCFKIEKLPLETVDMTKNKKKEKIKRPQLFVEGDELFGDRCVGEVGVGVGIERQ